MEATMDLFEQKTLTEQMKSIYNRVIQLETMLLCRPLLQAAQEAEEDLEKPTPQEDAYQALCEYEELFGLNFKAIAAIIRNRSEWGELKSPEAAAIQALHSRQGEPYYNRKRNAHEQVLSSKKAEILAEILRSITNI